jgi:hypothetical protein
LETTNSVLTPPLPKIKVAHENVYCEQMKTTIQQRTNARGPLCLERGREKASEMADRNTNLACSFAQSLTSLSFFFFFFFSLVGAESPPSLSFFFFFFSLVGAESSPSFSFFFFFFFSLDGVAGSDASASASFFFFDFFFSLDGAETA